MPKFKVLCRRDAFIDYVAEVEANTAEQAAQMASDDPDEFQWRREGDQEFEAKVYVTLGADGFEIDSTEVSVT